MRYISTRGGLTPQPFSSILIGGLAPDGGLVVPERYPTFSPSELAALRDKSYPELAFAVISRFVGDDDGHLAPAELQTLIGRTYTAELFGSEAITPVTPLAPGVFLLHLSNGPTLAFKDIAMQLLGNLFSHVLARRGETLTVLGATSGDTGSAAEYAMRGKDNIRVFMLSPHQKMSPFQTAQMFSLREPNIFNLAVRGVFDDCQDAVKAINEDATFKQRYRIGAVNSINWGRIVAQTVYYFKAFFAVTEHDGQAIDVAVPSGNFGNIYAGYVARQLGLPIRKLILASNENNVLDDFFRGGAYRVRPASEVQKTSSPSMDISKASNFERFIFDMVGRDAAKVRELWRQVNTAGGFDLSATPYFNAVRQSGLVSGTSRHADRLNTMRQVYKSHGVMIDTHTADGVKVGLEHRQDGIPLVCQETALPAKFEQTVIEALGQPPPRPAGLENLEQQPQHYEVIDPDADKIKAFITRHA